jgi:hypothetical protein
MLPQGRDDPGRTFHRAITNVVVKLFLDYPKNCKRYFQAVFAVVVPLRRLEAEAVSTRLRPAALAR